jgi:hypothetical protein
VSEACTCASIIAARQQVADPSLLSHYGLKVLHVLIKRHPAFLTGGGGGGGGKGTGGQTTTTTKTTKTDDTMVIGCLRHVFAKAFAPSSSSSATPPSPPNNNPSVLDAKAVRGQEDRRVLVKCLMLYCTLTAKTPPHQLDVSVLLDLLVVFTRPAVVDFAFLRDFFRKEVRTDGRGQRHKTQTHKTQTHSQ